MRRLSALFTANHRKEAQKAAAEKGDRPPMKDYRAEWVGETVWWRHIMKQPPIGRFNNYRAACFLAL
jgi:hypothetical protein